MNLINNNSIFFRDVDRIIRIIFKEIKMQDHVYTYSEDILSCFNLSNVNFRRIIKTKYIELYPENYHEDDLEYILDDLVLLLTNEYGTANAVFLISIVAKNILHFDLRQLFVNFDDLLEWDGFINKIDSNLFIASKLAESRYRSNISHLERTISHNNHYIHDLCHRINLSDNHMHLQASGYVTDINWFSFLEKNIFNRKYFEEFIKTEGIYNGIPKTKKNIWLLRNNILKIKCLRLILEDYLANYQSMEGKFDDVSSFSMSQVNDILNSQDVEIFCQSNYVKSIDFVSNKRMVLSKKIALDTNFYISEKLSQYEDTPLKYSVLEVDFLRKIFELVQDVRLKEPYLLYLFNLYICGATEIKFQFLQDNLGMGFTKFKEKENNKKWFITDYQMDINTSCFHKYYREKNIKNIELRVGPWNTGEEYINLIENLNQCNYDEWSRIKHEQQNPHIRKINFGLIIHFIKFKHQKDKSLVNEMVERRAILEEQSNAILNALYLIDQANKNPLDNRSLTNKIVGIDTANYELDNRPNLYGCVFRKLRYDKTTNQVLYATYHVGEEFPTLANGLRAIDEVITFCAYRSNDRLGHALALGIDVNSYFKAKRNNIMCYLEDYVDDLIWMYKLLSESPYAKDKQYLPFLRSEFEKYKHKLFSAIFRTDDLPCFEDYFDSYVLRGDDPNVYFDIRNDFHSVNYNQLCRRYGYKLNFHDLNHESAFLNEKARLIYLEYSFSERYRKKAIEPIKVPVTEMYIEIVNRVQYLLKEKILDRHIFIETNPTSNKKISYIMTVMKRYIYLYRLTLMIAAFFKLI